MEVGLRKAGGISVEVLPALGQSPAVIEPRDSALDDPALRQRDEAFDLLRSFDALGFEVRKEAGQSALKDRLLVGRV